MNTYLFLTILGIGIAVPFSLVLIINIMVKIKEGVNYQLNILALGKIYLVALVGWSLFISSMWGGK